jgi:hypothetical protein
MECRHHQPPTITSHHSDNTKGAIGEKRKKNVLAAIIFCAVDILLSPKPNPSSANGTFRYACIQPGLSLASKTNSNN